MSETIEQTVGIGELSRLVGISTHALRVWERRYGTPTPLRRPSGHRRYTLSQVDRLRLVAKALKLGFRAGVAVPASEEELKELIRRGQQQVVEKEEEDSVVTFSSPETKESGILPIGDQMFLSQLPGCA